MPGPRPAGSEISGSATAFIAKLFQNAQKKEKKPTPDHVRLFDMLHAH